MDIIDHQNLSQINFKFTNKKLHMNIATNKRFLLKKIHENHEVKNH